MDDPVLGTMGLFTVATINLSDKAFMKFQFGNLLDQEKDFSEIHYRKIDGLYYPSLIRSVSGYEFDDKTKKHHNVRSLIFYQVIDDPALFSKHKRKSKLKREVNIRKLKYKYDPVFWEEYQVGSQLSETEIIKASLNRKKKLKDQFEQNAKRRSKF